MYAPNSHKYICDMKSRDAHPRAKPTSPADPDWSAHLHALSARLHRESRDKADAHEQRLLEGEIRDNAPLRALHIARLAALRARLPLASIPITRVPRRVIPEPTSTHQILPPEIVKRIPASPYEVIDITSPNTSPCAKITIDITTPDDVTLNSNAPKGKIIIDVTSPDTPDINNLFKDDAVKIALETADHTP